jgi:RNA polymerase-associated protein
MLTLYDSPRCPYCARVRIVLAEKSISYETVAVDLDDRPGWIYDLNPTGRVPVIDDDGLVLAESRVLMEYLEERFPEPALLPADPSGRALVRLRLERFDGSLGGAYYDLRRERSSESARAVLDAAFDGLANLLTQQPYLSGDEYGLADCGYVPWIFRAEASLGIEVRARPSLADWLDRVEHRPAVAAELALVASGQLGWH